MELGNGQVGIVFHNIQINSIDTASGVFLGNNQAIGWSSHKKGNYGFGSASDTVSVGNSFIIADNDIIDSPIDDQDIYINNAHRCLSNNQIGFDEIKVNSLSTNSTVAVGENGQNNWSAHAKNNMGQGRMSGINFNKNNRNALVDNDSIDTPIDDKDFYK